MAKTLVQEVEEICKELDRKAIEILRKSHQNPPNFSDLDAKSSKPKPKSKKRIQQKRKGR